MPTPPTNALRVTHAERGWPRDGVAWGQALALAFAPARSPELLPEPLKVLASGDVVVWACSLVVGGRELNAVLKLQPIRSAWGRLRARLKRSRHHRQRRGAALLAKAGIPCAPVVVILTSPGWEILVMEAVEGPTLLEWLMTPEPTRAADAAVLAALAHSFGAMRKHGLINGDNKPSNLVLSAGADGLAISVVDTVEIVHHAPRTLDSARIEMLADLLKEPIGHKCQPTAAQCLRALYCLAPEVRADRSALRTVWALVTAAVGDPRAHRPRDRMPRVERLARVQWTGKRSEQVESAGH